MYTVFTVHMFLMRTMLRLYINQLSAKACTVVVYIPSQTVHCASVF